VKEDDLMKSGSNISGLPNPWLKKPMPKKVDKRSNFQDIIGNLDKKLKKSQLSFVNNRHFSLPQLKKADSRSTNTSAKKGPYDVNIGSVGSGGMGLRNNSYFGGQIKDWDGVKSTKDGTIGLDAEGKEISLKNSFRSNQDSLRTLKQVHYSLG